MDAAEVGMAAAELERVAEVRKARLLGEFLRLGGRYMLAPGLDRLADQRDLRPVQQVDVGAGADDDGIKGVLALRRHHARAGQDVAPRLAEPRRKGGVTLDAQHGLVRRRHLLTENVRIETPLARVVERRIAVQKAGE